MKVRRSDSETSLTSTEETGGGGGSSVGSCRGGGSSVGSCRGGGGSSVGSCRGERCDSPSSETPAGEGRGRSKPSTSRVEWFMVARGWSGLDARPERSDSLSSETQAVEGEGARTQPCVHTTSFTLKPPPVASEASEKAEVSPPDVARPSSGRVEWFMAARSAPSRGWSGMPVDVK